MKQPTCKGNTSEITFKFWLELAHTTLAINIAIYILYTNSKYAKPVYLRF